MSSGAAKKGATWRSLIMYALVTPAAMQLLARLDEHFEFSAFIGRLLRAWSAFIHGLWANWLALLPQWIELSANQIDALTWTVAMIGAVAFAPGGDSPAWRASPLQAAVLFWLAFACASAIFLAPYAPALARSMELEIERGGAFGAIRTVIGTLVMVAVAVWILVGYVLQYRRDNFHSELPPLWLHLEQVIGPMILGGWTGWLLGASELESARTVDEVGARQAMGLPALWERFLEPGLIGIVFVFCLLFVRRNNWPSMPRMIAAALGIFIADRIIVIADPLWRALTA
jgi:hypothetical protein